MYADFTPYRVIADHARAASFLIADGVVPGNTGRNYICRMIIRRAARFGTKLGLHEPFLAKVAEAFIQTYRDFYPELEKSHSAILEDLTREEIRFARTVEFGQARLADIVVETFPEGKPINENDKLILPGRKAFELYATYGLPLEITRDILRESTYMGKSLDVDETGFRVAMDEHRLASGGGKAMGKMGGEDADFYAGIIKELQKTGKLGQAGVEYNPYDWLQVEGSVLTLAADGQVLTEADAGDRVEVLLPKTGFYVESGGQVSDTGNISSSPPVTGRGTDWEIEITEMRKPAAGVIAHVGEVVFGHPKAGDLAIATVDAARRHDIMRNHTATHLLHASLHKVLGEHARQAGSLVAPDHLRFDFNHPEGMTPEQLERVERLVNEAVATDMVVTPKTKSRQQAITEGAMAFFGEKYGETVRTITITLDSNVSDVGQRHSYELCGGTHLDRTGNIGAFIILNESSAAAGVRRIEAVTGRGAYELVAKRFKLLKQAAATLKSAVDEVPHKASLLQDELAVAKKQAAALRTKLALSNFLFQLTNLGTIDGLYILAMELPNADKDTLGKLADKFREKYPQNGICVIGTVSGEQVIVMAAVTQDLIKKGIKAGDLVENISYQLGAGGGGAPHLAFGGGKDASKLPEALASVRSWVEGKMKWPKGGTSE